MNAILSIILICVVTALQAALSGRMILSINTVSSSCFAYLFLSFGCVWWAFSVLSINEVYMGSHTSHLQITDVTLIIFINQCVLWVFLRLYVYVNIYVTITWDVLWVLFLSSNQLFCFQCVVMVTQAWVDINYYDIIIIIIYFALP